jgi:hypothetical protein
MEHDHPPAWLRLPINTSVVIAEHVVRDGEDLLDDTIKLQLRELRVSILRASDGKITEVFNGTSSNLASTKHYGGMPWAWPGECMWWKNIYYLCNNVQGHVCNMECPDAVAMWASAGMTVEDRSEQDYHGNEDVDLPPKMFVSTICLRFSFETHYLELSTFIREAGLIWR